MSFPLPPRRPQYLDDDPFAGFAPAPARTPEPDNDPFAGFAPAPSRTQETPAASPAQPRSRLETLTDTVTPQDIDREFIQPREQQRRDAVPDDIRRLDQAAGALDPIPAGMERMQQSVENTLQSIIRTDEGLSSPDHDETTRQNLERARQTQIDELRRIADQPAMGAEQSANIRAIADVIERGADPRTIMQNIGAAGLQDEGGRTPMGWAGALPRLAASGLVGGAGATVEGAGLIAENLGSERVAPALRSAGEAITDFSQQIEPDERYGEGVIPDIARGVGSMGLYIGAGIPAALLTRTWGTVPRAVATGSTAATMAGPAGAAEAYQRAQQFGLSEEESVEVAMYGIPAGVVQVAPVAYILRALPAEVRSRALGQMRHVAEAAVGEFGAEGAGALLQNFVEQSYNDERGTWDDVLYQAMIGAAAGGITTGGLQLLTDGRGVAPVDPDVDPQTGLPEGAQRAEEVLGEDPEEAARRQQIEETRQRLESELLDRPSQPPATPAEQVSDAAETSPEPAPESTEAPPAPATPSRLQDWLEDPRTAQDISEAPQREAAERQRMLDEMRQAIDEAEAERARRGAQDAPIEIDGPEAVNDNAHITEQPTPAQAEAGNYRKRHVRWQGFDISIETEAGQERTGIGPDGQAWSVVMPAPYGDIKRTRGADGDPLDVYIGPSNTPSVFVVDQIDPSTGRFDEHKAMLGFDSADQAADTYQRAFSDGSAMERMGAMTPMTVAQFRQWVRNGNTRKPVAYQPPARDRAPRQPRSLLEFLASRGGLRPNPEIDYLDISNQTTRGFGRLIREDGMELDQAREAAAEAGFFGGDAESDVARSTIAQLLDMMDTEARFGRTATMRPDDRAAAERRQQARLENDPAYRQAMADRALADGLEQLGLPEGWLDPDVEGRAADLIMQGRDPIDAIEQAQMEIIAQDEQIGSEAVAAMEDEADAFDIPFESGEGRAQAREPGEDTGAQAAAPQVGEDDAGPGRPSPEAGAVEPGAEGLPQNLIPGVAPVTDADRLGLAADRPMAPTRPQAEPGGLFGPERDQTDIFDAPPAQPETPARQPEPTEPSTPEPETTTAPEDFGTPESPNVIALGRAFGAHFASPEGRFASIVQARRFAAERLGGAVQPGTEAAKAVDEAIEMGAVLAGREIVQSARAEGQGDAAIYDSLVDLYGRQPKLSVRSSTSVADQAYSTPIPLAFLASRLAGITPRSEVLEPSAGNGALLIEATPANATANEINESRRDVLNEQEFVVTRGLDAAIPSSYETPAMRGPFDVVIMNPPFGAARDESGRTRRFDADGLRTREIDHAIVMQSLTQMAEDGSAVLLVGGINKQARTEEARSDAYNGKAKREFYYALYNRYNVVDHFTVAGELWERQGAGWPVDVIVIRGKGKSDRALPAVDVPVILDSWDAVKGKLDAQYPAATRSADDAPGRPSRRDEPGRPDAGDGDGAGTGRVGEADSGRTDVGDPDGRSADVQPGPDRDQRADRAAAEPVSDGVPDSDESARPRADAGEAGAAVAQTEAQGETQAALEGEATTKPKPRKPAESERDRIDTSSAQVAYRPKSKAKGMQTLVPTNVQTAVSDALNELATRVGDIDAYVARELGMKADELGNYFGAEQVDGIALAIDNFSRGAGFIVGDQTGIGKGRQVAAVLRWSMRNGKKPIFVTEKPNLYADMYRDLVDVGVEDMLGRDIKILMTNSGESVPLTEDGSKVLKSQGAGPHGQLLRRLTNQGDLGDYDIVFTTYAQMQTVKKSETDRMRFLRAMATANGVLVMDESHNAGGQKQTGRDGERDDAPDMNRAVFARELTTVADAVLYSSATYAKRPDVMDLYAKTDMRLAVDDPADIGDLIAKGGVPMQQIVASMLSRAGQYLRRERSFDGIRYETPLVKVDRRAYEAFSNSIALIQDFSESYVGDAVKAMDKRLKAEAKRASPDNSTGGAGAASTNFTSIMHNVINQMLVSLTADASADQAIESLRNGEKPVITVASTLESFLKQYAEDTGVSVGEALDISMRDLLLRYLERSRIITVKPPNAQKGEKEHIRLTDSDLGALGRAAFDKARKAIENAGLESLPVSPIDWMRKRVIEAGYSIREITGRDYIIDYRSDGAQVLSQRPGAERSIRGRRQAISDFNSGVLDVLILNQAGSTGLSLHASEKVQDQRPRHMIIAQAEGNIDTHMQMLGRVNRTGQVVLPRYSQLVADVPATKRPAAVLSKKMASLNANTTGARSSAVTAKDVPDFMNEYGDRVAAAVMADNPDIHATLGSPLSEAEGGFEVAEAMRKVTGRIPLLPLQAQEDLYAMLESEYSAMIEQMEATGQNALEAKTLDLDARVTETLEARPPKDSDSPFADGVYFEKVDVKRIGRPMPSSEVLQRVREAAGVDESASLADAQKAARAQRKAMQDEQTQAFIAFRDEQVNAIEDPDKARAMRTKLDAVRGRWNDLANTVEAGQGVVLKTLEGNYYGMVMKVERTGKTKNPLALGSWKATIALADATRQITLPFSQLYTAAVKPTQIPDSWIEVERRDKVGSMPILEAFDDMQAERRETRTMVTGNILSGYDAVNGKGAIINFTDNENRLRQGILMPRDFDAEKFMAVKPVRFVSSDQILRFLEVQSSKRAPIESTDQLVSVSLQEDGDIRIQTDAGRGRGGRYFLNSSVLQAAGKDFVKASGKMRVSVPPTRAAHVLDAMRDAGAVFETKSDLDQARRIVDGGRGNPMAALARRQGAEADPSDGAMETMFFGDLGVQYVLTRRVGQEIDALEGDLVRRLDDLGLRHVGLRLVEKIRFMLDGQAMPADATYTRHMINLALDTADPAATIDHEAIHALYRGQTFTDAEWSVLSRQSQRAWMARFNIAEAYADQSEAVQIEEGIAHAFSAWRAGKLNVQGIVARVFRRIGDLIEAMGNALRGHGFQSANDVFRRIESGEVGLRFAEGQPPKSLNTGAMARRSPKTAMARQSTQQGFFAKGQPIDRAMRIPFDFFGGLDRTGAWRPGVKLWDKASHIVGKAKIDPKGPFGALSGMVEIARNGLIDRYGLDEAYITRDRARGLDERRILLEGMEVLTTLKDAGVGTQEAKVLQSILTGEAINDADMQKLAAPIREAIDGLGAEAVSLGLISADSFERNRGSYLHRVYQRHEDDMGQNALARFVNQAMRSRRRKIIGDQMKGRGIFFDIPLARLIRDDPEWKAAKRGRPEIGEKFRLFEFVPGRFTDTVSGQEREQRATRRVWWPADRAVPKRLQGEGWTERGTWEMRQAKGNNLTMWRDYTKEERLRMGEILDARYTIGRTYMLMAHDLAVGKFYKDISENEEWTRTSEPEAPWKDAGQYNRYWNDPEIQWVRVPEDVISKTGGKKRWGTLAGKWVRSEIWRDLNEIEIMSRPNTWRRILTQWKLNKTARSPVVHMNNIMSNMMFMDMANIRFQDLFAGLQSFVKNDQNYQEALQFGAFGADMMSQEIRDNVLRPILHELRSEVLDNTPNSFEHRTRVLGRIAERIWGWAKTADQKMVDAYRIEDEIFRMATYMRRRQFGDSPEQAATFAREQFLDYDIRAPWVNAARNTVLPFISYTYRAVPLIARSITYHPWKMPKYFLIAYMLNALAYMWDEGDDGEERERASMREAEQGYTWVGVPRMLRMPYRDDNGLPVFLDIRRWIPAGDIFDLQQGQSAVPIPAPLQLGGPLVLGAELVLNRQAFTGQDITNRQTDDWMDTSRNVGDWAWKSWMPSAAWVPNSWYWTRIANAASGATDAQGRPYQMSEALLSSVGIKARPQDVEEGLFWRERALQNIERELRTQARRLGRQRERGLISENVYEREMNAIFRKIGRLEEQAEDLSERSTPAGRQ